MLSIWLALLGSPAAAQEVPAYSLDTFGPPGGSDLAGRDGWVNGYAADPWRGGRTRARTMTDDNEADAPSSAYGEGGARDNWIVNGPNGRNVRVAAQGYNEDDDFLGIVFRHSGGENFYLVGISADAAPPPSARLGFSGFVMVYKIQDGQGSILAQEPVEDFNNVDIEVIASEGRIEVFANGLEITVNDDDPLPAGQTGFYGYDTGWQSWGAVTDAWFTEIEMAWLDRDLDGVPDDIDNCPDDYNPDQTDSNDNGIGDACDPTFEPGDSDDTGYAEDSDYSGDSDDSDDTDDTDDTDDPSEPEDAPLEDDNPIELVAGGCSCSGSTSQVGWVFALLPLLLFRRRAH
ncbi:MAG: hypothetical protein EA397_11490 [Deltaproteobacteria bacterium]|nr:MAG: hypothetical protein EA397_11490 [Deltaproteobacteria bacterium]